MKIKWKSYQRTYAIIDTHVILYRTERRFKKVFNARVDWWSANLGSLYGIRRRFSLENFPKIFFKICVLTLFNSVVIIKEDNFLIVLKRHYLGPYGNIIQLTKIKQIVIKICYTDCYHCYVTWFFLWLLSCYSCNDMKYIHALV